jgi:hypothetical protein
MCASRADPPTLRRDEHQAAHSGASHDLQFPPQYPFSWTLRGARAQRLREGSRSPVVRYRIAGSARHAAEIAAALAFCEAHDAKLELSWLN